MNIELTAKQKKVLSAIVELTQQLGTEPTYEQVRKMLHFKHLSSVQKFANKLKEKGYLTPERGLILNQPDESRMISIPLIGAVACGTPIFAYENIEGYVPYPAKNISNPKEDYFFLRAVGDSMNKANINGKNIEDGDFALIHRTNAGDPGQYVLALINENATIKKMAKGDGCIKLMPESSNEVHKPIIVFDDLLVQGIVVDIIKKMADT